MRTLIIGGTSFVGRAIALEAHARGHEVTVLNRGVTPSDLPDEVERLAGDRRGDLSALAGREFDSTIDVIAYRPSDVARLADALGARGGHHLQISSISAYRDAAAGGLGEAQLELHDDPSDPEAPITGETYGPLKAAAERAAHAHFSDVAIVRPTYVVGAHDATMRFPYWVERIARGGEVVVPASRGTLQWIDARDLAALCLNVVESGYVGACHAAGPAPAPLFREALEGVATAIAPAGTTLVEVELDEAVAMRFPLWPGPEGEGVLDVDTTLAHSLGLTTRPIADTVIEVAQWLGDRRAEWWVSAEEERELLAR
jgi:2'-hydroxyisoflavone reductase